MLLTTEIRCLLLILCGCLIGCKPQSPKQSNKHFKKEKIHKLLAFEKRPELDKWAFYHNSNFDSLQFLYAENAVKILKTGDVVEGRKQISEHHRLSSSGKLLSTKSDSLILANTVKVIEYEIFENRYENGQRHKNLVIWQTIDGERQRVFEFTAMKEDSIPSPLEIDERRKLWIDLCNRHDAEKLIHELYSKNTRYFNHKPVIKGRASLVDEYSYMNNENYELSLQPSIVDVVNENIIFEIGQCSGSYKGKYILIWKKDPDGIWRIFIDSNI